MSGTMNTIKFKMPRTPAISKNHHRVCRSITNALPLSVVENHRHNSDELQQRRRIVTVDTLVVSGPFGYDGFPQNVESGGADIVVGSLMKNLGGGIAPTGGYIAGRADLIAMVADRLTAPGIGKEQGANFNLNNSFFKGLFMAPHAVGEAIKTAVFAAYMMEKLGYENVSPRYDEKRTDIIQTVELKDRDSLVLFTQGLQESSPIDSYVRVMPAMMPGYPFEEVMACGAFTQGSTIELSADAPVIPPYTLYMQGGLSLEYGKLSIMLALTKIRHQKP